MPELRFLRHHPVYPYKLTYTLTVQLYSAVSAGEAQLFGKMLLLMMAVLEDISLWK